MQAGRGYILNRLRKQVVRILLPAVLAGVSMLIFSGCYVQIRDRQRPLVKLQPISGELELEAQYRRDEEKGANLSREADTTAFKELLRVKTQGDLYHPDFLAFKTALGLGLVQQFFKFNDITDDTYGELDEYNVNVQLLRAKPYATGFNLNKSENLIPRQFQGALRVENRNVGANMIIQSREWPMTLQWSRNEVEQNPLGSLEEDLLIQLRRDFFRQETDRFGYTLSHDFSDYSRLKFDFDWDEVTRRRLNGTVVTERNDYSLSHEWFFGPEHRHRLDSQFDFLDQSGMFEFKNWRWQERLQLQHRENFTTNYLARYTEEQRQDRTNRTIRGSAGFRHKLYESLVTAANVFAARSQISTGSEIDTRGGSLSVDYHKTNPWGVLSSTYSANYVITDQTGESDVGLVIDEEHVFIDPFPITLEKTGIDVASIVVTDVSGLEIYEEGDDYTVSIVNGRVQINATTLGANLPNIADGQLLLFDYEFLTDPERDRKSLFQNFRIAQEFGNGWTVFYAHNRRDEELSSEVSIGGPDEFRTNIFGAEYLKKGFSVSAEHSETESTIAPFKSTAVRAGYSRQINERTDAMVRASQQWLDFSGTEDHQVSLFSLGGRVSSRLSRRLRLLGSADFRTEEDNRSGPTDGFRLAGELKYDYRQFQLTTGLEYNLLERRSSDRQSSYLFFRIKRFF